MYRSQLGGSLGEMGTSCCLEAIIQLVSIEHTILSLLSLFCCQPLSSCAFLLTHFSQSFLSFPLPLLDARI